VTFVWEPIATAPGERRVTDDTAAAVMLTALAPDGRPLFRGRVPDQPATASPSASATTANTAAPASVTFEAPPGRLQLRIQVQGSAGQVVDSALQELTVPDYTAVQVAFGTPRVYRARTPRELQNLGTNPAAVPVADRVFPRSDRVLVKVDAYGPGGEKPPVTARLLNRAGTSMSDIPVQMTPAGEAQLELGVAGLAAGEYLLELNAKGASGTAQELVAFRVR
jgi:predicted secreted protein